MHVQQASLCFVSAGLLIGELAWGKCGVEPAARGGWPQRALVSAGLCPRGRSWSPSAALPGRQVASVGGVLPDARWPDCLPGLQVLALSYPFVFCPRGAQHSVAEPARVGQRGSPGLAEPARTEAVRAQPEQSVWSWRGQRPVGGPCCLCGRAVALLGVPCTVPAAALSSVCFGKEVSSGPRAACPWLC